MKYVIDIDGTICSNTDGNYKEAIPYSNRITKINQLYDRGNTIVLFTARGMKTYNGDVDMVYKMWYDYTRKQLKEWDVKYHELILGKPSADFYIDDKGLKDNEFFK